MNTDKLIQIKYDTIENHLDVFMAILNELEKYKDIVYTKEDNYQLQFYKLRDFLFELKSALSENVIADVDDSSPSDDFNNRFNKVTTDDKLDNLKNYVNQFIIDNPDILRK